MTAWVAAFALATLALATRGVGEWSWLVAAGAGAVGIGAPIRRTAERAQWWAVTITGVLLFALTHALWSARVSGGWAALAVSVVAAVCEEALFRRGLYGFIQRWGSLAAVLTTAVLFGLVHVPMYGWRALPIDVAAGLVFGWQRWSSGSWTAPAFTHALANAVQYL